MYIRVVRSGRPHRVGKQHILAVMNTVEPVRVGDLLTFVGADDRGVGLEVIAVSDNRYPETLPVIHAMPTAYRKEI